jgi:outer membrane protein assembly factor BamB
MRFYSTICLLLALSHGRLLATDWPHWRGALRDGHTLEDSGWATGTWKSLPTIWSAEVGVGGCSVVIAGGRLYTLGFTGGEDSLLCLDAKTGRELWRQSYSSREYGRHARGDQGFFKGPLGTPEIDLETGWIHTLGADGELQAWDGKAGGKRVWGFNVYDRFQVPQRPQVTRRGGSHRDYGYTSAPLVQRDQVIVEVGDPKQGNLMGFDKRTGKLLWQSANRDPAGHSGGISPITVDGIPCVAVLTALNLVVTRLDPGREGETVANYPWVTDFINNIPTPTVAGQDILVTSKYNRMSMARLRVSRSGIRKIWEQPVASGVCSPIIDGAHVYWANRGFYCLDFATGRTRWKGPRFRDAASLIMTRDKRLIVWSDRGDLTLVESADRSAGSYRELAGRRGVLRDTAWPHVVIADGLLYCKDRSGRIKCLSLKKTAGLPTPAPAATVKPTEPFDLANWPGTKLPLVLGWTAGGGKRNLCGELLKQGRISLETRGAAVFGSQREMKLGNGAFLLKGGTDLHEHFKKANQFTLEAILSSGGTRQKGPARIVSFSESAYRRNFTLGQEGDQFVIRLRTTKTGTNGSRPEVRFGKVRAGEQVHITVTYRAGELNCYQNGVPVFSKQGHVTGSLSNWTGQQFLIGDESDGGRPWIGKVYGMALYGRFLEAAEVARRFTEISE